MDVRFCPDCVSRGVDYPLMLAAECTHCGRRDAPISHRIANYEYRLRFAWDSLRFRLGVRTARSRARSTVSSLLSRVR